MKITKWNPISPRRSFLGNFTDDFFNTGLQDWFKTDWDVTYPSVNIREENDQFLVEFAAPGLKKSDFNIEIENNMLIISAEGSEENKESDKEKKYTKREFYYHSFKRSFYLPDTVDQNSIAAKYTDGILQVSIAKKEESKEVAPKKIEIS